MALKDRMAKTADRLITKFGFSTVLRRTTSGTIDPVTGNDTTTTTDYDVTAVATKLEMSQIDGTLIQQGDRMYVLTDAVEPQNGDKLKVGSEYWQVVNWQPKQVQDGHVAYTVQVRA